MRKSKSSQLSTRERQRSTQTTGKCLCASTYLKSRLIHTGTPNQRRRLMSFRKERGEARSFVSPNLLGFAFVFWDRYGYFASRKLPRLVSFKVLDLIHFFCRQEAAHEVRVEFRRPREGEQRLHEGMKIITCAYNLLTVALFLRSLFFASSSTT